MITIDCPICAGAATIDDDLASVDCEACDVTTDVAPDPLGRSLDAAA